MSLWFASFSSQISVAAPPPAILELLHSFIRRQDIPPGAFPPPPPPQITLHPSLHFQLNRPPPPWPLGARRERRTQSVEFVPVSPCPLKFWGCRFRQPLDVGLAPLEGPLPPPLHRRTLPSSPSPSLPTLTLPLPPTRLALFAIRRESAVRTGVGEGSY